jgi:hypothetical protein
MIVSDSICGGSLSTLSKEPNKIAISNQCERNSMEEANLCRTDNANNKIEFYMCRRIFA